MTMFDQIKKILHCFDVGILSERGLAVALEYEARHRTRRPARRS
jgi:hypothetical protein